MSPPVDRVSRIAICGELTIQNAADARQRLLDALADSDIVEVDLSEISELDSAGLQLLLATRKSAALAGKNLRLLGPSRAVTDTAAYLGVFDALSFVSDAEKRP